MTKKNIYQQLVNIFGEENVSESEIDKISYSKDYLPQELIYLQHQKIRYKPDFIVWAEKEEQICRLLKFANEEKIPVIPYGGGSGVCGGTIPIKGGIIVDLKKLNKILHIDEISLTCKVECGIIGQHFEEQLQERGYTLGHFPSSIYCSTIGGWLAGRSAGQLSTKYGKIEDMVLSVRVVLPSGEIIETVPSPRSATGPNFTQLFVGSEGTLGIITSATLRINKYPTHILFSGIMFEDVASGLLAIRKILQCGIKPAVVRLYDEFDTFLVGMSKKGKEEDNPSSLKMFLKLIKHRLEEVGIKNPTLINKASLLVKGKCLLVLVYEGLTSIVEEERKISNDICLSLGGKDLGEYPAKNWWVTRYDVSYNMSKIFEIGSFADTIDVATTWDKLYPLYIKIKNELSNLCFVMAHFSHAYTDGCSIYFSFVANQKNAISKDELYQKIWNTAAKICREVGGSISHHHGIGLSKAKFLKEELGDIMNVYCKIKKALDPNNILNPGKMGL